MHVDQNCLKILGKCQDNAFGKTREQLFFGKFSVSFRIINLKFNKKPWKNYFELISLKRFFGKLPANSRRKFVMFSLLPQINYLLPSQAWSVHQNLGLSTAQYGPCNRLINSNYYRATDTDRLSCNLIG